MSDQALSQMQDQEDRWEREDKEEHERQLQVKFDSILRKRLDNQRDEASTMTDFELAFLSSMTVDRIEALNRSIRKMYRIKDRLEKLQLVLQAEEMYRERKFQSAVESMEEINAFLRKEKDPKEGQE